MSLPAWPACNTLRCNECGEYKPRWEFEDFWCSVCRGLAPARVVVPAVAPLEPLDWTVIDCPWPGLSGLKYQRFTHAEAVTVARKFGGKVRRWAEPAEKNPALGTYPSYGQNHKGER